MLGRRGRVWVHGVLSRVGGIGEAAQTHSVCEALQWRAERVLLALVRILWELMLVPVGGRQPWEHSVGVQWRSLAIQLRRRAMLFVPATVCRPRVRLCIPV